MRKREKIEMKPCRHIEALLALMQAGNMSFWGNFFIDCHACKRSYTVYLNFNDSRWQQYEDTTITLKDGMKITKQDD